MYIGDTGVAGLFLVARELLDNALDEALAGRNNFVGIAIQPDGSIIVQDRAHGIPQGVKAIEMVVSGKKVVNRIPTMQAIFGELHTSGKFNSDAYKTSRGCFTGDTEVMLLDGTTQTFKQLYDSWHLRPKNHVFSVDPKTGRRTFGEITHVQLTKHVNELAIVTLSNGRKIKSTIDHPYYVNTPSGLKKVRAAKLKPGASLASLYLTESPRGYLGFTGGLDKGVTGTRHFGPYRHLHRAVYSQFNGGALPDDHHVHHVDGNKKNNDPSNLEALHYLDHHEEHRAEKQELWTRLNADSDVIEKQQIGKVLRILMRLVHEGLQPTAANYARFYKRGSPGWSTAQQYNVKDLYVVAEDTYNQLVELDTQALLEYVEYEEVSPVDAVLAANAKAAAKKAVARLQGREPTMENVNSGMTGVRQWSPYSIIMGWMSESEWLRYAATGDCTPYEDMSEAARIKRMLPYEAATWTESYVNRVLHNFVLWAHRAKPKNWLDVEERRPQSLTMPVKLRYMLAQRGIVGAARMTEWLRTYNYSVKSVEVVQCKQPVPVYGITVDDDHTYAIAPGVFVGNTHGVGAKGTNATASFFKVVTAYKGKTYSIGFEKGVLKSPVKQVPPVKNAPFGPLKSGTLVHFKPDPTIFKSAKFSMTLLREWASITAYLCPGFEIVAKQGGKTQRWYSERGIMDYIDARMKERKVTMLVENAPVFHYKSELADVVVAFTTNEGSDVRGFTSGLNNPDGGVHVDAVHKALYAAIEPFKKKRGATDFTANDFKDGMLGLINVNLHKAKFTGQNKSKLSDERIGKEFIEELTKSATSFFTKHKALRDRLLEKSAAFANLRTKFKASAAATRELNKVKRYGMPIKFASFDPKTPVAQRELYLVEGDSASGPGKRAKFPYQAILPLRGKILNVLTDAKNKAGESAEIINILAAIGYDAKAVDPLSKLQVGKIILLADPDPDGAHIELLLIALFYKYLPELFERGMIYVALTHEFYALHKGKVYLAGNTRELRAKMDAASVPASVPLKHIKGWGEIDAPLLRIMALDPASRRLVQLKPGTNFDRIEQLLGKDPAHRKRMLGIDVGSV